MSSPQESEVCHKEKAAESPPSLFQNGNIVFQAHHIGWIVAGCFTIIATLTSLWLVNKHLQWYTNKREQRYIVRLLFMVPLYAIISLASYLWWNNATPLILIRDGYESTVLTAFFYLLLMYLSHDQEEQRRIFMKYGLSRQNDAERMKKGEKLQRWVFPLGFIKWKPADGLYFLQLMKWGILQYCVIRPVTTLIAVILDYMGLYCESSWGLGWGHIYIVIIVSLSVTIAMYCLIQLYMSVSKDLAKHKPLLKLFAIKAVVFLTFWQATFLSVLTMFGIVKDTRYMTAEDINIGIGALLETFEMSLFAFLHIKAFSYKPYQPAYDANSYDPPPKQTPRLKSLGHAMDFRETIKELWVGCIYMWAKFRNKEPAPDAGALRVSHFEGAFGKQRPSQILPTHQNDNDDKETPQPTLPNVQVDIEEHIDIAGEKQWLGLGDDYGYGLKFLRKERSEGLEEQIEKELGKRGYTLRERDADTQHPGQTKHTKQKSWWRSIYNRISQTGHEPEEGGKNADLLSHSRSRTRGRSRSRRHSRDSDAGKRLLAHADIDLEDPPPQSIIRKNRRELRESVDKWRQTVDPLHATEDILMPLSVYAEHRRGHMHHGEQPTTPMTSDLSLAGPSGVKAQRSPVPDGSFSKMFLPSENDLSTELGHATEGARSVISSPEGYKLAKPTPPALLIPSQPTIVPTHQLGMAGERRSTLYHLADGNAHASMSADILDIEGHSNAEAAAGPTMPSHVHRRESANYQRSQRVPVGPDTVANPSTSATIPPAEHSTSPPLSAVELRRSSAQYYTSKGTSRKRTSLSPTTDIAYPLLPSQASPLRRHPNQTYTTGQHRHMGELSPTRVMRNSVRTPIPTSPPRNHNHRMVHSPTSIDDGLSRYPAHLSSALYPKIPRRP